MKSETSFRVFFLKQHRKNSLKNIFFPSESVFLDFSFWPQGHRSTQNAHCAMQWWGSSLPMSVWFLQCPILEMIFKQCTHLWGFRNTPTLPVSSLDQPQDGDLRSMTPVKAQGLLGVILSAPASTSCHLSQPFCNLPPISNLISPPAASLGNSTKIIK